MPLNGSYFENLFVHYMPRAQDWYKSDYNVFYKRPVKNYTIEDLIEADKKQEESLNLEADVDAKFVISPLPAL